jgi:hypothetical protein
MECDATASDEMVNVALPELKVLVPSVVLPSLKSTVPVGVPEPGADAVTVAVNVTLWLRIEGLTEVLIAAKVDALLTVCVRADDVLPMKVASPL